MPRFSIVDFRLFLAMKSNDSGATKAAIFAAPLLSSDGTTRLPAEPSFESCLRKKDAGCW